MANHDHVVLATSSDARGGECLTWEGRYAVFAPNLLAFISSVYKIRPVWMSGGSRVMRGMAYCVAAFPARLPSGCELNASHDARI